jgi:hypothetical protein
MADVEHVNQLTGHYEQETIRTPIARTKEQLTDGFAKGKTLRGQWATLRMVVQTIDRSLGAVQPIICRTRRLLKDVRTNCS